MTIQDRIENAGWQRCLEDLQNKGYGLLPRVLTDTECTGLIDQYADSTLYRKTIDMARYRFGEGEYKYFKYPLPPVIQALRESVYPLIAPTANKWMQQLKIEKQFPADLDGLIDICHAGGQERPTPLILKYGPGGYNTLHQDLYGDIYFPMQAVIFLNEPGEDYRGGEFLLIEQRPRAQSKAIVLTPGKGDMLLFTTNFRPVKGSAGYYRVGMKHGVSEVTAGVRHTLGIIFHDAG